MAKGAKKGGKSGMDVNTILGWLLAVACMIIGIITTTTHIMETGQVTVGLEANILGMLSNFWDPPSVFIVIGGSIAGLMLSYPLSAFAAIPKHMKIIFLPTKYNPHTTIEQIVEFAKEARVNGLLALEDKLNATDDEFLKNSLMKVVDSVEPEKVKQHLETELDYLDERHANARALYASGAAYGPAFGMIGTLIGLIKLLAQLDNPAILGPAMAVALITTLYGSLLANVVFQPIQTKLKVRHDEEYLCKTLISEGVQAIQAGDNPKFIEEKLTQLLPKAKAGKKGRKGAAEAESDDE